MMDVNREETSGTKKTEAYVLMMCVTVR